MKEFPILVDRKDFPYCPASVPLAFVEPHEQQAKENHHQTLSRLAERGGLDPVELLSVLNDRPFPQGLVDTRDATTAAIREIMKRVVAWTKGAIECTLEATAELATVWTCGLCGTDNTTRMALPARIECKFCRAIHGVKAA